MMQRAHFEIASFGELVGDPSRVAMLLSLMDGESRPASELARLARVTPSTASSHLRRLVGGGLLVCDASGRYRYFRLASEHVADALESLALSVVPARAANRAQAADPAREAFNHARTCYRHLAGTLGVAWMRALEERRFLKLHAGALVIAPRGIACFAELGLTTPSWPTGKACLDWTERKSHLGGALGRLLTDHLLTLRWLGRRREGRALRITTRGRIELERFGVPRARLDECL
jgi:DNA-binding transcriptional ArsR family regulator